MPGLRLLRAMPIRAGWDYTTVASPVPRDPSETNSEWQRPFAFVDLDGAGKWRFTDQVGGFEETAGLKTSYHLQMLSGAAGIQLVPGRGMPHCLAKNHYDTASPAPSNFNAEITYDRLRATVCGEWDAYCEGYHPGVNNAEGTIRKVVISIGDRARFDWMATDTVYDLQDGKLKKVTTGGALRDDRQLCQQLAQIAHDWYSTPRANLTIEYETLYHSALNLGDLITTIGANETIATVNAVVSQITYLPEEARASLSAGFAELDSAGLA